MRRFAFACIAVGSFVGVACDYDIPALPGGAAPTGGSPGSGGESGCTIKGCSQCEAPLVCDLDKGCVECRTNADCGGGKGAICDENRCVECTVDDISNCPDGSTCFKGQCDDTCNQPSDCNSSQGCVNPTCAINRCVCCTSNANCVQEDANLCAPNGTCRQCLDDDDCLQLFDDGSRPRCAPDGTCVECLVAQDCPQPGACQNNNSCRAACCSADDCALDSDTPVCNMASGFCGPCSFTVDCPVGQCDVVSGRCTQCQSDEDCSPELPACVNSICRECGEMRPCADPNVCVDGVCSAPP